MTESIWDSFFDSIYSQFGVNLSYVELDTNGNLSEPLPTKVYLQKGDSGSFFSLDSVPMFALSMVNGEPTSGGAQLAAVPREFEDTDDVIPVGPGDSGSGGGGGGDPSVVVNTCK